MLKKNVARAAGVLSLSTVIALGSAFAGEGPQNLKDWAKEAAVEIDNTMTYPSSALRKRAEGHIVYHVTVDRDGDVLDKELVGRPKDFEIRSLAKNVINRADFPAIPASYGKDEMTFVLDLTYAIEGSSFHTKMERLREGRVTGGPVTASSGSDTLSAGITILEGE